MSPSQSAIVVALSAPGQSKNALRQYGWPHSDRWGYLSGPGQVLLCFENRDVEQLYIDGVLDFVDDGSSKRRCAILKQGQSADIVAAVEIGRRDQEIRLLKVSFGATFEELEAAGKVGGGAVYSFDELLSSDLSTSTAPPLVFIHVPKAGGTTLNHILMKNYRWRLDSYGSDFFPRYYPEEFISLVGAPLPDDTRRPVFFTGHIDLGNAVFRYIPVRYVAITMLRDPVARVVSDFRFHSTLPTAEGDDIRSGKLSLMAFFRTLQKIHPEQYEIFAPRRDSWNRLDEAIRNLNDMVSLFGFQDRFDEFAVMLAATLGLPDVFYSPLNVTPLNAVAVTQEQRDELREALVDDIAFYDAAGEIYRQRMKKLGSNLAERVEQYRKAKAQHLTERQAAEPHPWRRFYA
jgi:hypothetical protein